MPGGESKGQHCGMRQHGIAPWHLDQYGIAWHNTHVKHQTIKHERARTSGRPRAARQAWRMERVQMTPACSVWPPEHPAKLV